MILFTIIMLCLLSSLFRPRPYFGFYGPRFYHRPGGFMRGPRGPMHHHHMGGPRRF